MAIKFPTRTNRGITLLEVLISIGILAIGLIGTLSLIPAGGSYLRKAQIEGRAASLIPNAFNTMQNAGLFGENAIDWTSHDSNHNEAEPDLWGYPSNPADVAIKNPSGATIVSWHVRDDPPWISGSAADPSSEIIVTASRIGAPPGEPPKEFKTESDENGDWHTPLLSTSFSISDPPNQEEERMKITNIGPSYDDISPNEYFDRWTITLTKGGGNLSVQLPKKDGSYYPAREDDALEQLSPTQYRYKHYKKRRKWGYFEGTSQLDFSLPSYESFLHRKNDLLNDAEELGLSSGYDQNHCRIFGEVWRYDTGIRSGEYEEWQQYANEITDGPDQPKDGDSYFTTDDATATWVGASAEMEGAIDYYQFTVLRGQTFKVAWPENNTINNSLSDRYLHAGDIPNLQVNRPVQIFWNDLPLPGANYVQNETDFVLCSAPGTGIVKLRVELRPLLPAGDPDEATVNPWRKNGEQFNEVYWRGGIPRTSLNLNDSVSPFLPLGNGTSFNYRLDLTVFGSTQVALIDPLMAAKIQEFAGINHPALYKAAEFQQFTDVSTIQVPFTLRRLNWKIVSDQRSTTNISSVATGLCRPEDVVVVKETEDELEAPEPWFEEQPLSDCHRAPVYKRYDNGWDYCDDCQRQCTFGQFPMARETDDRLSWMLTVQPERGGSIQNNWKAGNYFDVAVVVFHNRIFPTEGFTQVEGEYAFDSLWNENTGTIRIEIDRSQGIDGDDIRKMFAAGNWVMVAPKKADELQKIDWLKIQNAEFTRSASQTIVEIIPASEPNTNTDLTPVSPTTPNLVTLVYQGVVAVSRRSVRITE